MATYRSSSARAMTPAQIRSAVFGRTPLGRCGYREDEVHALLDRLAFEVAAWSRQADLLLRENDRIKDALRAWQTEQAARPGTTR